jgi:hypothetical protein
MYEIRTLGDMIFVYHPDKGVIPEDEMNVDYLEYVKWLFDGNTPEQVNLEMKVKD